MPNMPFPALINPSPIIEADWLVANKEAVLSKLSNEPQALSATEVKLLKDCTALFNPALALSVTESTSPNTKSILIYLLSKII